ncbi:hypothetical protein AB9M10_12645 [Rhodococcus erythropolis]
MASVATTMGSPTRITTSLVGESVQAPECDLLFVAVDVAARLGVEFSEVVKGAGRCHVAGGDRGLSRIDALRMGLLGGVGR